MISIPHLCPIDDEPTRSEQRQPLESSFDINELIEGELVEVNRVDSKPISGINPWKPRRPLGQTTPVLLNAAKGKGTEPEKSLCEIGENNLVHSIEEVPAESAPNETKKNKQLSLAELQNQSAIGELRDAILNRFPLASPVIVLMVGSENNIHTDFASARLAASLADMAIGNILLVDSCPLKRLTRAYEGIDYRGISNLMATAEPWQDLILSLPIGRLDFLPAGTSHWEHWGAETRLIQMASDWKRHYQFVLVTAGDAHQTIAKLWTSVCDGSYLMVSMKNSNPHIAESAVTELQASGARLLGCIATDYSQPELQPIMCQP